MVVLPGEKVPRAVPTSAINLCELSSSQGGTLQPEDETEGEEDQEEAEEELVDSKDQFAYLARTSLHPRGEEQSTRSRRHQWNADSEWGRLVLGEDEEAVADEVKDTTDQEAQDSLGEESDPGEMHEESGVDLSIYLTNTQDGRAEEGEEPNAILDTGAQGTVAGERWVRWFTTKVREAGHRRKLPTRRSKKTFRFGRDARRPKKEVELPMWVGGRRYDVWCSVIPESDSDKSLPLLLGLEDMTTLFRMNIRLADGMLDIQQRPQRLQFNRAGHPSVGILSMRSRCELTLIQKKPGKSVTL